MTNLIYLASPYNSPDPEIRERRYKAAVRAACTVLHMGLSVFSPIVHNHPLILHRDLGRGWKLWQPQNENILIRCDQLWVLTLDGWDKSVGVAGEIAIARRQRIKIQAATFTGAQDDLKIGDLVLP